VRKVPGEVSVTVTVQVEPWLTFTGVVQVRIVVVARRLTTTLAVPLLGPNWFVTPGYDAVTAAVPDVDAVKVEVHVADAVVPARVHGVNEPVTPVWARFTVPVGVVAPVAEVSVTVTLQVEAWLITIGVAQVTVVEVGCAADTTVIVTA